MVKERSCPMSAGEMSLTRCKDRSDGLKWGCRKQVNGKRHNTEVSMRKGTWAGLFESQLTLTQDKTLTEELFFLV